MHYEQFKQHDLRVLKTLVESFPFATICINGPEGPVTAHAPLTFKQGGTANGTIEFHLAKANPIMPFLKDGTPVSITINGPSAPISPSWYTARFAGGAPDRSKTAPTYNYIRATLNGVIEIMDTASLTAQITDLVAANEPADGWKMQEIDPAIFARWLGLISGFRMPIASFDLTAKLSQEQNIADKPGILAGLRKRGTAADMAIAALIEQYDGSAESLVDGICKARLKA